MTNKIRVIVEVTLPDGAPDKEADLAAYIAAALPSQYRIERSYEFAPMRVKQFTPFLRMFLKAQNGVNYFRGETAGKAKGRALDGAIHNGYPALK